MTIKSLRYDHWEKCKFYNESIVPYHFDVSVAIGVISKDYCNNLARVFVAKLAPSLRDSEETNFND